MEISVQIGRDDIKLKDLVYRRYGGSAENIFSMPFFDGCELIRYALDAETEDRLFFRWSLRYQTQMSFEEFKEKTGFSVSEEFKSETGIGFEEEDNRNAEEILKTVKGIIG